MTEQELKNLLTAAGELACMAGSRAADLNELARSQYSFRGNYTPESVNFYDNSIEVILGDSYETDKDCVGVSFEDLLLTNEEWKIKMDMAQKEIAGTKRLKEKNAAKMLKKVKLAQYEALKKELDL